MSIQRKGDEPSEVIEALQHWLDSFEQLIEGLKDGSLDYGASPEEMKELVKQWDTVRYWVYGDEVGDVSECGQDHCNSDRCHLPSDCSLGTESHERHRELLH